MFSPSPSPPATGSANLESLDQLQEIGIKELLEHDPRPTFILDLDPEDLNSPYRKDRLDFVLCNEALRSYHALIDSIALDSDDATLSEADSKSSADFRAWATSITKFDDSRDVYPFTHIYRNMLWTGLTIRKRWRVISGNQYYQVADVPNPAHNPKSPVESTAGSRTSEAAARASLRETAYSSPQDARKPSTSMQSKGHTDNSQDTVATSLAEARQDEARRRGMMSSRGSNHTMKTAGSALSLTLNVPESGTPDWTASKPRGVLSEHICFARSIEWASTPLGAMETWSKELRQAANLVMANPHPAALFWGSDMTVLYNEAYRDEVAGNKHPGLMGTGAEGPFGEIWDQLGPLFVDCARTGLSIRRDNHYLPIERHGYLEETYFSWSFTPLYGGGSTILGFYNAPFETTRDCVSHRRMRTLQRLGTAITSAKTVKQFWKYILLGLQDSEHDVPFALLYSVVDSEDGDEVSVSSGSTLSLKSCMFEGSIAIPAGHPASPNRLDLKRSKEGFIPSFRDAMRTRQPTRIQVRDGTLPEALLEGISWRGFGEPCKDAIIFPVRPTNGDAVMAFLLVGINPRRAYDEDYQSFSNLINRQLATSLASVLLFEDEMKRSQNAIIAATLQQEKLNEQLAIQTNRLRRMTAHSPLGMFYINSDGLLLEANDRYYEMTMQDRDDLTEMGWMEQLTESSKPVMTEGWHRLTVDLLPWTAELQLKAKRFDSVNPSAEPIDYWVMATSQPEIGPDGQLRSVMGSITDISHLKWAQGLQERRLREAEERRRQQNEFIDITSHEMRNPLSAILQCADDIASTMTEYQSRNNNNKASPIIDSCIESANTIALCVQHQKSIVDDILTVSKLDSNLLELAPIPCQPTKVARGVMKMFESELLAKKINFKFVEKLDYEELGVDWVTMDSSRISQILINLMTNAIKFTSECETRQITLGIGASKEILRKTFTNDFEYIPRKDIAANKAFGKDWDSNDTIYLRMKVTDTGCGLTPEEMRLLFQRFQQASPRTHAQYGGSGLGLFISRQLTELHGGQIGVASEFNKGSTFGFYIRTRKLPRPKNADTSNLSSNNKWQPSTPRLIATHIGKEPQNSAPVSNTPASSTPTQAQPSTEAALHILVVEDNLVNQKVLVRQLRKVGCTVYAADDGQKALDFLETTSFHLEQGGKPLSVVLMDLEMPVMDGLTCVRHIRRLERENVIKSHVPVIAVTANARLEQVIAAKEAGMDNVVSKPFRIPELLTKINDLLSAGGAANITDSEVSTTAVG